MRAWIKLAGAVVSGAAVSVVLELALDAVTEDNSSAEELDALVREPYITAGRLLLDARAANTPAYRFECLGKRGQPELGCAGAARGQPDLRSLHLARQRFLYGD